LPHFFLGFGTQRNKQNPKEEEEEKETADMLQGLFWLHGKTSSLHSNYTSEMCNKEPPVYVRRSCPPGYSEREENERLIIRTSPGPAALDLFTTAAAA